MFNSCTVTGLKMKIKTEIDNSADVAERLNSSPSPKIPSEVADGCSLHKLVCTSCGLSFKNTDDICKGPDGTDDDWTEEDIELAHLETINVCLKKIKSLNKDLAGNFPKNSCASIAKQRQISEHKRLLDSSISLYINGQLPPKPVKSHRKDHRCASTLKELCKNLPSTSDSCSSDIPSLNHVCNICEDVFESYNDLSEHTIRHHNGKPRQHWSYKELNLLASLEANLQKEEEKHVNINLTLSHYHPSRTLDAIKAVRRRTKYREILESYLNH